MLIVTSILQKIKKIILTFLIFTGWTSLEAQKIFTADLKKIHTYTIGYQMPLLTRPEFQYTHGFTAGFEYFIKYQEKNRESKNRKVYGTDRILFLNNSLGGYFDLDSMNSLYFHSQIAKRFIWRPGFKLEGMAGIGYLRRYPNKDNFTDKTPFFTNVKDNGTGYFMPSFSLGIGWDFYRCCKVPLSLNIRPGMYYQLPAEKAYKPYYNLEAGLSVSFYKKKEKTFKEKIKEIFSKKPKKK